MRQGYLNRYMAIGIVRRDIEVHACEGHGGHLGRTSIVLTKRFHRADGTSAEKTTSVVLVFPPHMLEAALKVVTKGRHIFIEGEMETRECTSLGGEQLCVAEIRVEDYQLLSSE